MDLHSCKWPPDKSKGTGLIMSQAVRFRSQFIDSMRATSPCSPARPVWFVSCFNRPGGAGLTNARQNERLVGGLVNSSHACAKEHVHG